MTLTMSKVTRTIARVKILVFLVILLSISASLAACGEDGSNANDSSAGSGASETTPQFDPDLVMEGLPDVLADVNGEPVRREELKLLLTDPLALKTIQTELGVLDSGSEELKRLAVDMLVGRHLILQEGERRDVVIADEKLDEALVDLRRQFQDLESFGAWMQARGIDEESLLKVLADELTANQVREGLLDDVTITDEQAREYYEAHQQDFGEGEEVRLGIIVVESNAKAQEIVDALRDGQEFASLAQRESTGSRAEQGGDTGWVALESLEPQLRELVATLEAGEAAGPLQTGSGEFLVVGMDGRRPTQVSSFDQAREEIERRALQEKQDQALDAWLEQQKAQAKIEIYI